MSLGLAIAGRSIDRAAASCCTSINELLLVCGGYLKYFTASSPIECVSLPDIRTLDNEGSFAQISVYVSDTHIVL